MINLVDIYKEQVKLLSEKKKKKKFDKYKLEKEEGEEIIYDDSIYDILEKGVYKLTQISKGVRKEIDKGVAKNYDPDNASDRSLFNKKANRVIIDGYRYGFNTREIRDIKRELSKTNN
jgi:hypothetical protein